MITCSNCNIEATFKYNVSETSAIYYCGLHLPRFLKGKSPAALLVSRVEPPKVEEEAVTTSKKKSTKKDPEPVVEETAVEESTEETVEETDGTN